jgi:aspartate/methionine/tyrosine aminotransferase
VSASLRNTRLASIGPSAIRAMHDRKKETSIDLGMGQPTLHPDIAPFEKALEWVRAHGCPYAPPGGLPELRERIAHIYGGYSFASARNVAILNGSQEGIYLAVKALLDPSSDEVLMTDPSYPSYGRCCDLEGVRHRTVRLSANDGFTIRAEPVLAALTPATRLIIIGSPANPTGSVMEEREIRRLARALADRKGPPIWLVVDEVYRELTFTAKPPASALDHYPHAIAIHSLSKSCALTGLRVGFLIAASEIIEAVVRAHGLMMLNVNMFAQHVALEIVREPSRLRAHHAWYVDQRQTLIETARAAGLHIVEPQGAFYSMLALPEQWSSSQAAADHLLERYDVVTVAGVVFGNATEGFLRLSWVAPKPVLIEGLQRVAQFCSRSASS